MSKKCFTAVAACIVATGLQIAIPSAKLTAQTLPPGISPGYGHLPRDFVDANGDSLVDYCRFVGYPDNIYLACALGTPGGSFDVATQWNFKSVSRFFDQGYSDRPRGFRDVNADGRADYCRFVGNPDYIYESCNLATSQRFDLNQYTFTAPRPQPIILYNGWLPYGYEYANPDVLVDNGIVYVGGSIRNGSWSNIAQIPSGISAPSQRLIFSVNNHDSITRLDLLPNGLIVYAGGSTNHGWVSLEGMTYIPSGGTPLQLLNGWSNYGWEYAPATVAKVGDRVVIQGLVKNPGNWNTSQVIATLPEGMRPSATLTFGGNVHDSSARIDILPNGDVKYISGKRTWEWLSLSGIVFTVGSTRSLALAGGWTNYANGYATPRLATTNTLRPISGLAQGSSGQIATLPLTISGRRIFSVMKGGKPSRVDVLPDGRVYHIVGGEAGSTPLSFSGIFIR